MCLISFGEIASFVSALPVLCRVLDMVDGCTFTSSSATELFSSFKVIVGHSLASLTNLLLVRLESFDRWPFLDGFLVVCCSFHLIIDNSTKSIHWNWWNPVCVPSPGYSCVVCSSLKTLELRWHVCLLHYSLVYILLWHKDHPAWQFCAKHSISWAIFVPRQLCGLHSFSTVWEPHNGSSG